MIERINLKKLLRAALIAQSIVLFGYFSAYRTTSKAGNDQTSYTKLDGKCPLSWKKKGNKCYLGFAKHLTPVDAAKVCEALNATLPKLTSIQENAQLLELAIEDALISKRRDIKEPWAIQIGLLGDLKSWKWPDTSVSDFYNWAPGEPNHLNAEPEYCVEMYVAVDWNPDESVWKLSGKWNAQGCDIENRFYCQKARANLCNSEAASDEEGSCAVQLAHRLTHNEATDTCLGLGGYLPIVRDARESAALHRTRPFVSRRRLDTWLSNQSDIFWIDADPRRPCFLLDENQNVRLSSCINRTFFLCEISLGPISTVTDQGMVSKVATDETMVILKAADSKIPRG